MLFMRNQDAYLYQNKINNLELLFACVIQYIRKALYIHEVMDRSLRFCKEIYWNKIKKIK